MGSETRRGVPPGPAWRSGGARVALAPVAAALLAGAPATAGVAQPAGGAPGEALDAGVIVRAGFSTVF